VTVEARPTPRCLDGDVPLNADFKRQKPAPPNIIFHDPVLDGDKRFKLHLALERP
jgi:hypothetical protein